MLGGHEVHSKVKCLGTLVRNLPGRAVFVTNEVGSGIVPDTALGRRFRDEQGRLNQVMADVCDAVVLVSAGLPLQLKPRMMPKLQAWNDSEDALS